MFFSQWPYFKIVAETENYSEAARRLNISQSTLSHTIANLENELGVELFSKKGRGVELNIYGRLLYQYVKEGLDSIDEGERKLLEMISPKTGHIRISSLYTLGVNFMPYLIRDFCAENPLVTFSLHQQPTRIQLNMLQNDEVDLCFCTDFEGFEGTEDFEKAIILIENLYVLVNKNHPLANNKYVNLKDLKDEEWIFFNDETYFKRPALKIFEMCGYTPKIRFESNEDATVAGFVAANLGIALIPPILGVNTEETIPLRITYPVCQRYMCMAWKKHTATAPIITKFRDYVLRWLPENKKLQEDAFVQKFFKNEA